MDKSPAWSSQDLGSTENVEPNPEHQDQYNCVGALEVRCNFSGGEGTSDLIGIPSPLPRPHSSRCLDQ